MISRRLSSLLGLLFLASSCASAPPSAKSGDQFARASGSNPKEIIFIHGMFMTPKSWVHWEKYFQERGYKVSSPAWPLHEGTVESLRAPEKHEELGRLELAHVVEHYRELLKGKPTKPILIGHSMGGLIAQILLAEGLAQAAVGVHSAPPKGVFTLSWSFLKSNWPAVNPFASSDRPIEMDFDSFSYAFANAQSPEEKARAYNEFYVPESRRVGKGPTLDVARIDASKPRGPLLLLAGSADHIIPAKLNYKNFGMYDETPGYTEFALLEGRDHWTVGAPGWDKVVAQVDQWLKARFAE